MSYQAGLSAEEQVSQDYVRRGFAIAARRWRGKAGEIDLVVQDGDGVVFVEVKQSATFDKAVERVSSRQMSRLYTSGQEYIGNMPRGALTDVRFDVGLVNGHGEVRIIENAFGHG
jgi:putative endonuclease